MNIDENLHDSFYENKDENFKHALNMCEQSFSHKELKFMLKEGNIPQRQYAAMVFDSIEDDSDINVLLSNLTGCDGKIREAVAGKINEFLKANINLRSKFSKYSGEVFADATIDINANICRLVIDSAVLLKQHSDFTKIYVNKILNYTNQSFDELDKFIFRDKKYVINKQLFKLYWCLEALKYFADCADEKILHKILEKSISQKEYTIREKAAEIIVKNSICPELLTKLKKDDNYYVRQAALYH